MGLGFFLLTGINKNALQTGNHRIGCKQTGKN